MTTRAAFACLVLLAPAFFAACEGSDIAVFSDSSVGAAASAGVGDDDAAAGAGPTDTPCHRSEECPAGRFCAKLGCQDMLGVCEPQPICFDASASPVCGCNHVTYWNDCLRQQHGISASSPGECGAGAKACTSNAECDRGTCAHLLLPPATCDAPSGPGTCWVTPPDCGATTDRRGWLQCPPPQMASGGGDGSNGGAGPVPCASTCEALHDGHPFTPLDGGAACP